MSLFQKTLLAKSNLKTLPYSNSPNPNNWPETLPEPSTDMSIRHTQKWPPGVAIAKKTKRLCALDYIVQPKVTIPQWPLYATLGRRKWESSGAD